MEPRQDPLISPTVSQDRGQFENELHARRARACVGSPALELPLGKSDQLGKIVNLDRRKPRLECSNDRSRFLNANRWLLLQQVTNDVSDGFCFDQRSISEV